MSSVDSGILVLADDLSGAAEAAATLGTPVRILLTDSTSPLPHPEFAADASRPDVAESPSDVADSSPDAAESSSDVAVDLDCRYLSPAEAGSRTSTALAGLGTGDSFTFVKVDSLLRGNITAHLSAALERESGSVIFAPALPQQNRTVVDGVPFLDGARLEATRAWNVEDGSPPARLSDLCPETPTPLGLKRLRSSEPQKLAELFRSARLITADAETMGDLKLIVGLARSTGATVIGSAALARAFAETRQAPPEPSTDPEASRSRTESAPATAPQDTAEPAILFALGTAAERIEAQLAHLRAHAAVEVLDIPADQVAVWSDDARSLAVVAEEVRARLAKGHLVVRLTDSGESVDPRPLPGLLADLLAQSLTDFGPMQLVATGGETARAVLDRLGVRALDVIREIHPGAVLSQVTATSARPNERTELCRVVTRPGGQGDESSLTLIHDALMRTSTRSASSPRTSVRTTKENE